MSETTRPKPQFGTSRDLLIMAIMEIAFGAIVLCFPDQTSTLFNSIIAIALIVIGGATAFAYLSKKSTGPFELVLLPIGLTCVTFGIILFVKPTLLNSILGVALAVLLLFSGFCTLQVAIVFAKRKLKGWYFPLIFAAVAVICGVLILVGPFSSDSVMAIFLGVSMVVGGVLLLVTKYFVSKAEKLLAAQAAAVPPPVTPSAVTPPTATPPAATPKVNAPQTTPPVKQDNP